MNRHRALTLLFILVTTAACSDPESYSGDNINARFETTTTSDGSTMSNTTSEETSSTTSSGTSITTTPDQEDPCAQASCGAPPICDVGCEDACGCCDCEESYCGDDGALYQCAVEGCYERVDCESPCVVIDGAAQCPEEDPCATVGCGAPPVCGEMCSEACGCCDCRPGETFCVDNTLHTCRDDGGCYEQVVCRTGCVSGDDGAMCEARASCDDIEAEYEAIVNSAENQSCGGGPDACQVLRGHCAVGLGGCWYGVNSDVTQDSLDAIADRWQAAGCRGPVCRCPAEPQVRCDAGGCLLRQ